MKLGGLYALPPGADFAAGVVDGLLKRNAGQPPETLAQVTIHANSLRTMNALRAAFEARGPLLMPRLRLIADLGDGPIAAPLGRRLDLGALISGLVARRPALAGGQAVPELARSLAGLMAEMQSEGCPPDVFDRLDVGDHAEHWRLSQDFLTIAARFALTGDVRDREARQRVAAECLAADWAAGRNRPDGSVIVAGSTGSHGATQLFLRAVASLPQGAVILPGFDMTQPPAVWSALAGSAGDHPQSRFAPLLAEFGAPAPWTDAAPDQGRNRLISLALRPAPVTDQWIAEGPRLGDLLPPTAALTLIEARTPQAEAEAIAIAIREAVEAGRRVTLIAADRLLTRRVAAALDRWDLVADDSAGQPLSLTAPGMFLRQVAALHGRPLTLDSLLALLKSQVTASGTGAPGDHLRLTRDLELHLRRNGPAFPTGDFLRGWAATAGREAWGGWLADLLDRIVPLGTDREPLPLPDRLARHRALAEALAAGPGGDAARSSLFARQAGGLARGVLDHLTSQADTLHWLTARDFAALLDAELQAQAVRAETPPHPLIRIRGPREARTEATGLVILGGLNEGSWPQAPAPDPWLSRQMRAAAGLTLPERAIGLAAHDFQQAVAAEAVILTRAARDAEAETVPSRWLNRLVNLMKGLPGQNGPAALKAMQTRGQRYLSLAEELARPGTAIPPAPRPAPRPPSPAFSSISVTQVATLIRDPYAIYASAVLRLRPLPPLRPEADASLRGTVLHEITRRFLSPAPAPGTPPDVLAARFMAIADDVLAQQVPWPSARAFWMHRLRQIAPQLMADEAVRLAEGQPIVIERKTLFAVPLPDPALSLRLVAQPDRIDLLPGGAARVYDYKTGSPPSARDIESHDKQLPLTAALLTRGAFVPPGAAQVEGMAYIHLGGKGMTEDRTMSEDAVAETWDRFVALAMRYLTGTAGFTARRTAGGHASDYEHLSRAGEWGPETLPTQIALAHPPGAAND
ncbi:double-strand break repair protein AddB [Paracoccus suum]|uniref:Double-strand break repair protein AddB n=1 Tax=Paracoccus suum TaxID=2259340 RepID=A0A344PHQ3_9RHOB|nr:PD-(D/E)XK nuclease family protein [Paracoccus suum]AXC48908.1 double-strand break repair protein AddB [Paracoccus suum]